MPTAVSSKYGREILKAIKPMVEKVGARCRIDFPKGNHGHHRLIIEYNNQERFSVIGGTPSSRHYIKLKINDVKKILKELGALSNAKLS